MGGDDMSLAVALIEEIRSHGVALAIDGDNLKLSGQRPLPADVMQRLRTSKPIIIMELRASLPWWRDQDAIQVRFDEIAGQAEYDNGADRDAAERIARDCLAIELRHAGLADGAIYSAINKLMGCAQ
jgi:hypothetical protein